MLYFDVDKKLRVVNTTLVSYREPFKRKGNSVETEETIIYLYKMNTTSI
jgi:hypothetical protein